jgi:hypothetical protein
VTPDPEEPERMFRLQIRVEPPAHEVGDTLVSLLRRVHELELATIRFDADARC